MRSSGSNRDYLDGDLFLPEQSGYGIKHGAYPGAGSFGWRDITGQVLVRGVAATDPTWTQIASSPFSAYAFAVNDFVWFVWHIPHDYLPGSECYLHAHWLVDGTDAATVKWEWTYMYAEGFNQQNYNVTGTVITAEQAAAGTAYRHMVAETAAIDMGIDEPDGVIYARLRRVTNGGVDNADTVFLITSDVHYQSTNIGTINKAPSFYGA